MMSTELVEALRTLGDLLQDEGLEYELVCDSEIRRSGLDSVRSLVARRSWTRSDRTRLFCPEYAAPRPDTRSHTDLPVLAEGACAIRYRRKGRCDLHAGAAR